MNEPFLSDQASRHAPELLQAIVSETAALGFTMASEPKTGALLAALAASKPGGRLLELGTGTGIGTAWLLSGMDGDARLDTVDVDEQATAIARRHLSSDPRLRVSSRGRRRVPQPLAQGPLRSHLCRCVAWQVLAPRRRVVAADRRRYLLHRRSSAPTELAGRTCAKGDSAHRDAREQDRLRDGEAGVGLRPDDGRADAALARAWQLESLLQNRNLAGVVDVVLDDTVEEDVVRHAGPERARCECRWWVRRVSSLAAPSRRRSSWRARIRVGPAPPANACPLDHQPPASHPRSACRRRRRPAAWRFRSSRRSCAGRAPRPNGRLGWVARWRASRRCPRESPATASRARDRRRARAAARQ